MEKKAKNMDVPKSMVVSAVYGKSPTSIFYIHGKKAMNT